MTDRADQLHHHNAPAHSTSLVQAFFFGKASHHPGLSAPLHPKFGSLRLLTFPRAKIAIDREEICECNGHRVHKVSQWRLTADWLDSRKDNYSRMHSKVSSDWLPSHIKATRLVLKIFKMAVYFPDSSRTSLLMQCKQYCNALMHIWNDWPEKYVEWEDKNAHGISVRKCVKSG